MRITLPASLNTPELQCLFATLAPAQCRFVGGCVRDAVLGLANPDIDIATTALPAQVIEAAHSLGFSAIPTGAAHGTVTVITLNGQHFEITTLRRDVSTDGRRATVAFSENFAEDAARRDLTCNALYAEPNGTLHDYFDGLADLKAGRIRFIGNAETRIAEDALRLLRFFRFYARFGKERPQPALLTTLKSHMGQLNILSAERITQELLKTMPYLNAETLALMDECQVLKILGLNRKPVLPFPAAFTPLMRLFCLAPTAQTFHSPFFTFSNADYKMLNRTFNALNTLPLQAETSQQLKRHLYLFGAEPTATALWMHHQTTLAEQALSTAIPQFPVNGADVIKAGVVEGPQVGKVLHQLEVWWIEHNYPERDVCLQQLNAVISS